MASIERHDKKKNGASSSSLETIAPKVLVGITQKLNEKAVYSFITVIQKWVSYTNKREPTINQKDTPRDPKRSVLNKSYDPYFILTDSKKSLAQDKVEYTII